MVQSSQTLGTFQEEEKTSFCAGTIDSNDDMPLQLPRLSKPENEATPSKGTAESSRVLMIANSLLTSHLHVQTLFFLLIRFMLGYF